MSKALETLNGSYIHLLATGLFEHVFHQDLNQEKCKLV